LKTTTPAAHIHRLEARPARFSPCFQAIAFGKGLAFLTREEDKEMKKAMAVD